MEETKEWLERAEKDLSDAKFNLKGSRFEVSAFLSHQAAEKALKALFILRHKRLWKIHDLVRLSERVDAPKKIINLSDMLNPHYFTTRYPLEVEYNKEKATNALKFARGVVKWVKGEIRRIEK